MGYRAMAHSASAAAERLYSIDEAAALWSLSRDVIERLLARGELEFVRIGRRRRIPASSLEAYAAAHGESYPQVPGTYPQVR